MGSAAGRRLAELRRCNAAGAHHGTRRQLLDAAMLADIDDALTDEQQR